MKRNYRKQVTRSFKITQCGLMDTNIAEEPAASIFREEVFIYKNQNTWRHIPESNNLDILRHDILESISLGIVPLFLSTPP
jgi:hypothetical protein